MSLFTAGDQMDEYERLDTPPAPTEAVAWRFRTADRTFGQPGPWAYGGEPIEGATPGYYEIEPLYAPPQPDALPGDLREKVAREVWIAFTGNPSAWPRKTERNETAKYCWAAADAILSLIQSERGGA